MDPQLNGKLALVSGSTACIGYAMASTLAQEGAAVTVNSVLPGPTKSRGAGDFVEDMAQSVARASSRSRPSS
jgi:NAD(P)-dependent dehydrogenase (short-subunit alcohol dehydrogenase family)